MIGRANMIYQVNMLRSFFYLICFFCGGMLALYCLSHGRTYYCTGGARHLYPLFSFLFFFSLFRVFSSVSSVSLQFHRKCFRACRIQFDNMALRYLEGALCFVLPVISYFPWFLVFLLC